MAASGDVCADAETLASYVDDGLSATERAEWEAHFATCPKCRRALALMSRLKETSAAESRQQATVAPRGGGSASGAGSHRWVWLPLAASVLVGAGLWGATRLATQSDRAPSAAAVTTVAQSTPAAEPALKDLDRREPAATAAPADAIARDSAFADKTGRAGSTGRVAGGGQEPSQEKQNANRERLKEGAEIQKPAAPPAPSTSAFGQLQSTSAPARAATPSAPQSSPQSATQDTLRQSGPHAQQQQSFAAQQQGAAQHQPAQQAATSPGGASPAGAPQPQAPPPAEAGRRDAGTAPAPPPSPVVAGGINNANAANGANANGANAANGANTVNGAPSGPSSAVSNVNVNAEAKALAKPKPATASTETTVASTAGKSGDGRVASAGKPANAPAQEGAKPQAAAATASTQTADASAAANKSADEERASNAPKGASATGTGGVPARAIAKRVPAEPRVDDGESGAAPGGAKSDAKDAKKEATGRNLRDLLTPTPAERTQGLMAIVSDPTNPARRWRVFRVGRIETSENAGESWTGAPITGTGAGSGSGAGFGTTTAAAPVAGAAFSANITTPLPFFDIASPAPGVCWVVGAHGIVWHKAPAKAWQLQHVPSGEDLTAVTATNALDAIVTTASGQRLRTTDAGQTWSRVPPM